MDIFFPLHLESFTTENWLKNPTKINLLSIKLRSLSRGLKEKWFKKLIQYVVPESPCFIILTSDF